MSAEINPLVKSTDERLKGTINDDENEEDELIKRVATKVT